VYLYVVLTDYDIVSPLRDLTKEML